MKQFRDVYMNILFYTYIIYIIYLFHFNFDIYAFINQV